MKIEFNDEQLTLLKEVLDEYAEISYQDMIEYKKVAVDAEDEQIAREYNALAESEEAYFNRVKRLGEYVIKYEELMGNA